MFPVDIPVTPDADQARSWLEDELSRDEYSTELSLLTKTIRMLLQTIRDIFSDFGSDTGIPIETLVLGLSSILLLVIVVIVVFNPIRLRKRARSSVVFESDDLTLSQAQANFEDSKKRKSWDEAYIWAFRLLVLNLAHARFLRDGPGLTAHEAAREAGTRLGGGNIEDELNEHAHIFDSIRYGEGAAEASQVLSLEELTIRVQSQMRALKSEGRE